MREGTFDIFNRIYDQIEQIFNTVVKFMQNPDPDQNYGWYK